MSGPGSTRRPVSSGRGAPPPRRAGGSTPAPDLDPEAVSSAPPPAARTVVEPDDRPTSTADTSSRPTGRARAPWWLRVLAWVVAVPLGLVLVGVPARKLGYLDSQKLLDIVIGEDTGRYLPLVVIVVLWAVVTAVLVQLIIEGSGWLVRRRRRRRARSA